MTQASVNTSPQELSLSVFFPAYNDAPALPALVSKTVAAAKELTEDFEIIAVNDGSHDDTAAVLEQLRGQYHPFLRVVTHDVNRGYGAALRSGFEAATKEFVFYTDGDGQYDPGELRKLVEAAASAPDIDWVNGYKLSRSDSFSRIAIGKGYNWLVRRLFGLPLRDVDCDFRLIRRSRLKPAELESTGGTICVELSRQLHDSGAKLAEAGVRHYPRLHGKSQFFRLGPLATTFVQLIQLYWRLIVWPRLAASPLAAGAAMAGVLLLLSLITYGRSMHLPFISDDYVQIALGRDYGAPAGWSALMADALYRCRATSLIVTHWTERAFGLDPLAYNLSAVFVHALNSFLVFALGCWKAIGWRVSAIAACFFAVSQRHSEAVIWYASLPELLVFLFSIGALLCWILWMQGGGGKYYGSSLALFVLALFSKESAVVAIPLCLLVALPREHWRRALPGIVPFAALAVGYFLLAYQARGTHLHFQDGTFSLAAPFLSVVLRSGLNLLWVWGLAALVAIAFFWRPEWKRLLQIAAVWIPVTLLPYSFLTYMSRVPSRHTYFASVGLSLLVAAGLIAVARRSPANRPWLAPAVAVAILVHQTGYIWTVKHEQYRMRAQPTEHLVDAGRASGGNVYAKCFPYSEEVAAYAFRVHAMPVKLVTGAEARTQRSAIDFCNAVAHE